MFDSVNTAARHIFRQRYRVYIPRSFMYGSEYIRKVGYHSTGNTLVDQMSIKDLTIMNQTIAGWAILHHQGAELILADEKDAIPIYKAIQQHLRDWLDFSRLNLHPDFCPPVDDFRALEAIAMYYHIRVQELEPIPQTHSTLKNALLGMNRGASYRSTTRTQRGIDTDEIKPYVSMVDDIEKNLYGD